ncbi:MAG: VWA domain-containing protein [Clostridia bacterium]|nr:VWA domain-containing protein [Clostridia bacterium]
MMAKTVKRNLDICVLLDISQSLEKCAESIRKSLLDLVANLKNSKQLSGYDIHFTLCGFSDNKEEIVSFVPLQDVDTSVIKRIEFAGQTNPAPAINFVVNEALKRYEEWGKQSGKRVRPIIFFFTDGNPYPREKYYDSFLRSAKAVQEYAANEKLLSIAAGCGTVDRENLRKLTCRDGFVIKLTDDIESICKFFSEIITETTKNSFTKGLDQIEDFLVQLGR